MACEHLHVDRVDFSSVDSRVAAFGPDGVVDSCAMTLADVESVVPYLPDVPCVVLSSQDVYLAYQLLSHGGEGEQPVPISEDAAVRTLRYPYRGVFAGADDAYDKLDVEPAYLARGGTVLRLPRVYGPHDGQRREEPLLRRVRAGRAAIPVAAGTWLWSKGYVDEVAGAVLAVLDAPAAAGGEVFNICESETVSMRRWCEQILAAAGAQHTQLISVPDSEVPDDLRFSVPRRHQLLMSPTKAERLLGWRHRDAEETIEASVRWHLAHPPADNAEFAKDDAALKSACLPPRRSRMRSRHTRQADAAVPRVLGAR